jgi:signal transduction histidine kinase
MLETTRDDHRLSRLIEVGRSLLSELDLDVVLDRVLETARELTGARFAALGILDERRRELAQFLTRGVDEETHRAIGDLPRGRGILGLLIEEPVPLRLRDLGEHPRSYGFPPGHPPMRGFLGVPILIRGEAWGNLYLTEKAGGDFDQDDEDAVVVLADWAAIAIENARLYERSRELSAIEERNRLARDLHDSVAQKLFGIVLAAQSAATLLERSAPEAREQVLRLQALAQETQGELRSLVFQLRPAAIEADGLAAALAKHVDVLRRVHRLRIDLDADGAGGLHPGVDEEVFRIAQEALHNALRHAAASRLDVRLRERDGALALEVADDGIGFDPDAAEPRSRRLGLTSMEERAAALGATLRIDSAPGRGTTISLEVPLDGDPRPHR